MSLKSVLMLLGLTAVFWAGVSSKATSCMTNGGMILKHFVIKKGSTPVTAIDISGGLYTFTGNFEVSRNAIGVKNLRSRLTITATVNVQVFLFHVSKSIDVCQMIAPNVLNCNLPLMTCPQAQGFVTAKHLCDSSDRLKGATDAIFKEELLPDGRAAISKMNIPGKITKGLVDLKLEIYNDDSGEKIGCIQDKIGVNF